MIFFLCQSDLCITIKSMNDPQIETSQELPQKDIRVSRKDSFFDLLKFAILAFIIVMPIRAFVAQPFIVSGSSMIPTFKDGQYLIVDEISYRLEKPKRGEIIIFKAPPEPSKYYIKRVVGLPGETVVINGSDVYIKNAEHPAGFKLDEPYVTHPSYNDMTVTLTNTQYFAMGDNRAASSDSRSWGPLPEKNIVGRALIRLFPLREINLNPGYYKNI